MSTPWKEEYSVGVPQIDTQHKTIFMFLNELEQLGHLGHDVELLHRSIAFLKEYVKQHFAFEEDCMFRYACPIAAENQEAHRKFLTAFDRIVDRYEHKEDASVLLKEVQSTVQLWLVNHIIRIDAKLKEYVKQ